MKSKTTIAALVAMLAFSVPATLLAADEKPGEDAPKKEDPAKKEKDVKPYPLDTCIVSGEKIGDDGVTFEHKGQEIKLCCKNCRKDFDADPAKYLKKLEGK